VAPLSFFVITHTHADAGIVDRLIDSYAAWCRDVLPSFHVTTYDVLVASSDPGRETVWHSARREKREAEGAGCIRKTLCLTLVRRRAVLKY